VTRVVHPIEEESFRVLRGLVDLTALAPLSRAVAERVVHSSADLEYAESLVLDEPALEAGRAALLAGAPLVVDVRAVATMVTSREALVALAEPGTAELAAAEGLTRSAAGVRLALERVGPGAVWAIGNAPTALWELLSRREAARPALVVGLPVGFVGAAESKAALAASGLPCATNRGPKGGSAAAAAAVNALLYHSTEEGTP
jgi:precorrin-8X/cobalt-precorrin-8 methylmutase